MIELEFKKICLYPNPQKPVAKQDYEKIVRKLHSLGCTMTVTDSSYASEQIPFAKAEEAFPHSDLAVVLGGDGTMLSAARLARTTGTPLLGINFGTLGYMTELEIHEIDLLDNLQYATLENRMMLDANITAADQTVSGPYSALNEVAATKSDPGSLIRITLLCDGSEVSSYRADGMIFATPTGSSAYNLSAGGPIIDPKLNAVSVCPLAAFTLASVRPMIFSPESVLQLRIEGNANIVADGKQIASVTESGILTLSQSKSVIHLVKLKQAAFYEVLKRKLS